MYRHNCLDLFFIFMPDIMMMNWTFSFGSDRGPRRGDLVSACVPVCGILCSKGLSMEFQTYLKGPRDHISFLLHTLRCLSAYFIIHSEPEKLSPVFLAARIFLLLCIKSFMIFYQLTFILLILHELQYSKYFNSFFASFDRLFFLVCSYLH